MLQLSGEAEKIVRATMRARNFKSIDEYVDAAEKALAFKWLNEELQIGIDQLNRGEKLPYDDKRINLKLEERFNQ